MPALKGMRHASYVFSLTWACKELGHAAFPADELSRRGWLP